jgi:hypothetical protein
MHQGRALPAPRTLEESGGAKKSTINKGNKVERGGEALP